MTIEEENTALRAQLAALHHYLEPLVGLIRLYGGMPKPDDVVKYPVTGDVGSATAAILTRAEKCSEVLSNEAEAAKMWQTEVENHATSVALDAWRKDLMELYMEHFGVAVAMGAFNAGREAEAGAFRNLAFGIPSDAFTKGSGTNDALRAIVKQALKEALKGPVVAEVKL